MSGLRKLKLLAVINSLGSTKFDPVKVYIKVFRGLGSMPGMFKITLKSDAQPVRLYSLRFIAAALRSCVQQEIDRMPVNNVTETVEQHTDWCSGLTITPKAGGRIRRCACVFVDLTNLNKCVRREIYLLPQIADMLCKLPKGAMCYII